MRRWLWLLAGAALFVALSCSLFGGGNQADDEPGVVATMPADEQEGGECAGGDDVQTMGERAAGSTGG